MKTPVCLITPPSVFLLDERVFPNLGILKVAAALEARSVPVEHVDLDGVANFEEAIAAHAEHTGASHFCITCTTPQLPAVVKIAHVLRRLRPEIPQIIGGPHPTLVAAAMKKEAARGVQGRATRAMQDLQDLFDVVVAGDGEDSIIEALRQPSKARVGGRGTFINADDPKGIFFLTKKRLEETPQPARHLIDLPSYKYTIDGARSTSLIAQLGCPYGCNFCGGRASPMLRRVRIRSTESVLAEIEHLYSVYGYLGYMMYDDELNVNPKMVELMRGITALQRRLGVEFRLRGFVKSERFTQEQADVMYEAGFRWVLTGFESGSPRILENIEKKADVDDNDRCVAYARKAGLKTKALMSVGHAGESLETIEETRQWLLRTKPDDFDVTVISVYCGSPYYDDAVETAPGIWTFTAKNGDRLHSREVDYRLDSQHYKGVPGEYVASVFTDYLTSEEIVFWRDHVENDVRAHLGIPFNAGQAALRYEHSMGQAGPLPSSILRLSGNTI